MSEEEATLDEFVTSGDKNSTEQTSQQQYLPEIGELPSDWRLMTVEEIADRIVGGGTPSKSNEEYWDGEIPWASVKDLNGVRLAETEDTITESGVKNSATNLVPTDSIIISTRMTVGEPFLNEVDMAINQDMKAIIPDTEKVNTLFGVYSLWDKDPYLKSLGRGTTVDGITTRDLSSTHLGLPSLSEQRKIATVLHTVDQAIQKTEEIIEQMQTVRSSTIDNLLSYGFYNYDNILSKDSMSISQGGINTDLDRTSVGTTPQEWDTVRLEEITKSSLYGVAESAEEYNVEKPRYLRITDISSDGRLKKDEPASLSSDKFDSKYMLSEGEILFARSGATVGKTYLYQNSDPDSVYGGYLIRYKPDTTKVLPKYLFYYTQSTAYNNWVTRVTRKGAQANINAEEYSSILLPLPTINEQKEIIKIVNSQEELIANEISYQSILQRLKQGLMQDLLSGAVRTTDSNIEVPDEVAKYG